MSPRAAALLLAALLAATSYPTAPAAAQAPGPPARCDPDAVRYVTCIEALHRDPIMVDVGSHLYRVAWRPVPTAVPGNRTLSDALVVGGLPAYLPGVAPHGLVLLYDGVRLAKLWDKEGPQFVDVAWHPSGGWALAITDQKAIYRVDAPGPNRPQYTFRNLWDDCAHVEIAGCQDAYFQGRHVSFNPSTGEAWIAGSSLLSYDGSTLSVVESGADIAYRAVSWAPDGKTALLSALVCVNQNDLSVDTACPSNITASEILGGRVILADTATNKLCEVYTYGRFNPQRAEVNDITWHPSGDYALIYGDDDFRGTILKFDARHGSEGQTSQGCPKLGGSFAYLEDMKDEGEFNKMSYNAATGRFWAAAGAGKELWEGTGTRFLDMLGEHDITGGRGTIYYGVAWDPSNTYVLVSGFRGLLYKIVPANAPFAHVTTPKNNTLVTGDVLLAGKGFATSQFEHITRIEGSVRPVRLDVAEQGNGTGWRDATVTATNGRLPNWRLSWNASELTERHYVLRAQALEGAAWVDLGSRLVSAQPSAAAADAGFEVVPPLELASNFTYEWQPVAGNARLFTVTANATRAAIAANAGQGATPSAVRVEVRPAVLNVVPTGPAQNLTAVPGDDVRGVRNWTAAWATGALPEGLYQIEVHVQQDAIGSNTARRTVQVVRPQALEVPVFAEGLPTNSSDGSYDVRWLAVDGEDLTYEVEESVLPPEFAQAGAVALSSGVGFGGEERLVFRGPGLALAAVGKDDGVYLYRVRARNPVSVSAWSAPLAVSVAVDTDGDGFSDQEEVRCGSQLTNADSTCDDIDADGVPNPGDAFPLDPRQTKDTDGDGVGDSFDRFPLDYREWADADNDTWGDNAERRLGADPFNAASSPETDDDGDGCLNKDEAAARTDPKDPAAGPGFCLRTPTGPPGTSNPTPGAGAFAALAGAALAAVAMRRKR
ncbi:MAG TPA: hypothetical protein VGR28_04685 [Candidatus Thermoplasmatota archaeon]|jgi:hypothetical protein|nr:hypothetical protein [Candidatus Thermoplasmatota archaeon]